MDLGSALANLLAAIAMQKQMNGVLNATQKPAQVDVSTLLNRPTIRLDGAGLQEIYRVDGSDGKTSVICRTSSPQGQPLLYRVDIQPVMDNSQLPQGGTFQTVQPTVPAQPNYTPQPTYPQTTYPQSSYRPGMNPPNLQ